jgi:hypothetical protein
MFRRAEEIDARQAERQRQVAERASARDGAE